MFKIVDRNGKKELFEFVQYVNKPTSVVVLDDSIDLLSSYAFNNKYVGKVDLIYITDNITEIPAHCFERCPARAIRMSPNVKVIGEWAFANMPNLWMLRIPEGCNCGIKRYDGIWVNQETLFENSPKHATKWRPWIDTTIDNGVVTVLWESNPNDLLLTSTDAKTWKVVKPDKPELYQYNVDGVRRFFRVGANAIDKASPRNWNGTFVFKTSIVQVR